MPPTNELLHQRRYRVIRQIEQDKTGAILEAFDNVLEKNVALKQSAAKMTSGAAADKNFVAEAEALKAIDHESLQQIEDYFSDGDRQYLVLEAIAGSNLAERVEKQKNPFALAEISIWADQLLDALHRLHTRLPPIIHRHISPRNLRLTADGKIKLLMAAVVKNADAEANAPLRKQSPDAASLPFLPLEQIWHGLDAASRKVIQNSYDEKSEKILDQPADARSDVYALGATLYYLLTARQPVDALERSIEILDGKSDPLPTPHQLNRSVPPEISDVLMRSLELKRENRFSSAVIMRQVLRTAFVRMKERENNVAPPENVAETVESETPEAQTPAVVVAPPVAPIENAPRVGESKAAGKVAAKANDAEILDLDDGELLELDDAEIDSALAEIPSAAVPAVAASEMPKLRAVPDVPTLKVEKSPDVSDDLPNLFSAPPKSGSGKRIAAIAAAFVALAGAGGGFWILNNSQPVAANQAVVNQISSSNVAPTPEPSVAAPPAPVTETTAANAPPNVAATPNVSEASVTTPEAEIRTRNYSPAPVAPRVKKIAPAPVAAPPTKVAANPKRAVTVDDLINSN